MGELDKAARIWIRDSIVYCFQAHFRKRSERLTLAPMEMKMMTFHGTIFMSCHDTICHNLFNNIVELLFYGIKNI